MMDFFSQAREPHGGNMPVGLTTPPGVSDDFVQAVGTRNAPALTARLDTATPVLTRPLASLSLSSPPPPRLSFSRPSSRSPQPAQRSSMPAEFAPLTPAELPGALAVPNTLLIDIRPNASYADARLPRAISLSVPSTLLKRPAFSLQKLSTMMRAASRDQFLAWRSSSNIIVYDADTSALAEGSNILGLLRKFKAEGFAGNIAWIRGGFTAVWKEARTIIVDAPLSDGSDGEDGQGLKPAIAQGGLLQARNLPMSAFQQSTTTTAARPLASAPAGPTQAGAAPPASTRVLAANPFFSNIRQNMELSQGVTERIPLLLPPHIVGRVNDIPFQWLRDIASREQDEEAEMLAMQFYKIELGEQRRLQGIMNHHSQNAFVTARDDFPYSITAGIEKGSKNRYRDIWPFEHSRVRLRASAEDGSDYVNASFICPLGTRRRYIATQGPLPTTYTDFWTLCWEQNVAVIVMLTRQVEGANVKCGEYWIEERYGPMRLQTVSVHGPPDDAERAVPGASGFDFNEGGGASPPRLSPSTNVIQRKFYLTHDEYPDRPPRVVTQLQYIAWPDVNVPDSADGLLWLIDAVDRAMADAKEAANIVDHDEDPGPVLLHCSAGVGRTGGFIVVDAVLDALRRELRKQRQATSTSPQQARTAPMDVDHTRSSASPPEQDDPLESALENDATSSRCAPVSLRDAVPSAASWRLASSAVASKSRPSPTARSSGSLGSRQSFNEPGSLQGDDRSTSSSSKPSGLFESQEGATSSSSVDLDPSPSPAKDPNDVVMTDHVDEEAEERRFAATTTPQVRMRPSNTYFEKPAARASALTVETHSTSAYDYALPRTREDSGDSSPPPLSTYDEPIREVLEDMRQQRMSLCQSLRQYVFVHRAIIEGALAIVDEQLGSSRPGSSTTAPGLVPVPRPALGARSLSKSSSLKRKQRTSPDEQNESQRDKAAHAAAVSAIRQ